MITPTDSPPTPPTPIPPHPHTPTHTTAAVCHRDLHACQLAAPVLQRLLPASVWSNGRGGWRVPDPGCVCPAVSFPPCCLCLRAILRQLLATLRGSLPPSAMSAAHPACGPLMPWAAVASLAGGGGGAWAVAHIPAGGGRRHHCILPHLAPHPHHFAGCKRRRVWALHGECRVLGHCCNRVLGAPCIAAWRPGRLDTRCHWEGYARRLVAWAQGQADQA